MKLLFLLNFNKIVQLYMSLKFGNAVKTRSIKTQLETIHPFENGTVRAHN